MSQVVDPSLVEQGRAALDRHEWRPAYDLFTEADARGDLAGGDLELLAQASWWVGRLPEAIAARERAYAAAMSANRPMEAAVAAIFLSRDNAFRNNASMGVAWGSRAERLLADQPEGRAHGWLDAVRGFQSAQSNRLHEALEHAQKALEIGRRLGDRDLEALALSCVGLTKVYLGQVDEGLAALDEAAISATAGGLEPQTAGGVCCAAIGASAALGDWRRAADWTEAQDRWCKREHINGFPGMCRLYRAESKRVRGEWLDAEAEARRAADELVGFIPIAVGIAMYEIGVIRLRRGDLPAAEEALIRAHSQNREPEPALSLVRLAQGNVGAASESIRRALDDPPATQVAWSAPPGSQINRLTLLPAQVTIALAANDVPLARRAADELSSLAGSYPSLTVRADTAMAQGAVLVAEGDRAGGTAALRQAVDLWTELEAPYEAAQTRVLLASAYAAEGARERALLEIRAARGAFERLGATLDLRSADESIASLAATGTAIGPGAEPDSERADRTFMFTDIVDSTKLAELMGDAAWHDLIRWHDQAIRSVVAEHQGQEVKTIGDGFFLAFTGPEQALAAASAIQRRLAEHRQTQGFAPAVRIGIHRADAQRAGLDYIGTGVNVAARIGAQADGGEILVSAATLSGAHGRYAETGRRSAALKGVAQPVEVVGIDWR